jgi:bifunctional NMN adenylyltransferase/nudix hydrolase
MNKRFDVAVVIGRFQPVHNAHVEMLRRAGEQANQVVVIVGSAAKPRTYKNPWVSREREAMLIEAVAPLQESTGARYHIEHNRDTIYNDAAWVVRVQELVSRHSQEGDRVALFGHKKDASSFYLNMFPQWTFVQQDLIENLNATEIRNIYFTPEVCNLNWFKGVLPDTTLAYLRWFKDSPEYNQVVRERQFLDKYRKQQAAYPYPIIFVTADAVVIQSGHVLMVQRGADPGNGLWALPGGFVDATGDRTMEDAAIRELREETGIKVPEKVLRGSIQGNRVFDAPDRSQRGRTITHAFHICLEDGEWNLPRVRGSDDAARAQWIPISRLNSEEIFEDHYDIIMHFLGK